MRTDRREVIRGGIGVAVAMVLGSVSTPEEAFAQGPPQATPPENPPTLAACLPRLDWDPAERGPLLIVAPERAWLEGAGPFFSLRSGIAEKPEPVPLGRNGYRLATISPRYRRKLTAVGTLSAVVPDTMAVLRYKNLPEPDIYAGIRPENRPQLLLSTLSPAQWRRVLSPDGLGMGDLKRDQQAMFAGLFPETAKLYRTNPPAPGQEYGKTELVPLDTVNVSAVRLRLYQDLYWTYLFKDPKGGALHMGDNPSSNTEPTYRLQIEDPSAMHYSYGYNDNGEVARDVSVFGVNLLEAQPNRAKPSAIVYEAATWDVRVSLADARTVGDLIARVREATGIELYADKRYAELPVHTRVAPNTAVRSGDLLKAVAISVTGTFRRVASGSEVAFVLTDDLIGSGVRFATLSDWIRGGEERLRGKLEQLGKAAREANVSDTAQWGLRQDTVPSSALLEKLASRRGLPIPSSEKIGERLIPLAELPTGVQERVRAQQESWRARAATADSDDIHHKPIREDGVMIEVKPKLAAVLPGIGTVPLPTEDMNFGSQAYGGGDQPEMAWYRSGMTPPDTTATLPLRLEERSFPRRFVVVAVKSADDARQAARLAHTRHFTGLVFAVGEQPPKEIAEWVSAARGAAPDVAVWLRTPLLRQSIAKDPDAGETVTANRLDLNVMGETYTRSLRRPAAQNPFYGGFDPSPVDDNSAGDYLTVGDPDALRSARSRVVSLVSGVPGIAGLLFTDTIPPGYMNGAMTAPDRELGYTPPARLAFLREAGADPIDLSPVGELEQHGWMPGMNRVQTRVRLPNFPDMGPNVGNSTINGQPATIMGAKDLYPRWYAFRAKQLAVAHDALRTAIKTENPRIEVLVQHSGMWGMMLEWPPPTGTAASQAKPVPSAKPASPPAFQWLPFSFEDRTPEGAPTMKRSDRFARQMARSVEWIRKPTPEARAAMASTKYGLLLDLSRVSVTDTDEILSQIVIGLETK